VAESTQVEERLAFAMFAQHLGRLQAKKAYDDVHGVLSIPWGVTALQLHCGFSSHVGHDEIMNRTVDKYDIC
jgi:hypothetical protein